MGSVKIGIIGLGSMAQSVHIPTLLSIDDAEIIAICDNDQSKIKQVRSKYKFPTQYSNYIEMAERSEVDAVFVLTKPHETHFEIAKIFLENNKDVFCEKPMAMKLSEAEQMVNLAKKHSQLLIIGFNRRYMPLLKRVKEKIENKSIQTILSEVTSFSPLRQGLYTGWIHSVDLLRWFCGEPKRVQCYAKYEDPYYEQTIVSIIDFNTGICGILWCNFTSGKYIERVEIHGDGLSINTILPYSLEITEGPKNYYEPILSECLTISTWVDWTEKMGYKLQDIHFIQCIKSRENPITSAEDSIKSHELVNLIYQNCGLPTLE
jgi:virulence factor